MTISRASVPTWTRPFPLWQPRGPDGWGAPTAPAWLSTDWTARGGRLGAITLRAAKAQHGRREVRLLWALCDPELKADAGRAGEAGVPWPYRAQVCRVQRQRIVLTGGGVIADDSRQVTYYITSRAPDRADARALADRIRGHGGIENTAHHVRDVPCAADACRIRSGSAPAVGTACLNLVIALRRRAGATNLAAALRTCAGRPTSAVRLVQTAKVMK